MVTSCFYSTIPFGVAAKVYEIFPKLFGVGEPLRVRPTYAEVFDEAMAHNFVILIARSHSQWSYIIGRTFDFDTFDDTVEIDGDGFGKWADAADAAIVKFLELYKTIDR